MENGKLIRKKGTGFVTGSFFVAKELGAVYKQILQFVVFLRYTKNKADRFGISFFAQRGRIQWNR